MDEVVTKWRSRKWRLTLLIFFASCGFALINMLSSELANIFTGLGVSYNGFQGLVDWQKAKNEKSESD